MTASNMTHSVNGINKTLGAELVSLKDVGKTFGRGNKKIEALLQRFPAERIRRQLDWLPHRQARNPAALLIRAQSAGSTRSGKVGTPAQTRLNWT